ncbi:MAG: phage antirepressor Ant [Ruminococcaceae bacterium]|nr:phage antirepressor Ant [Oscillospiraceae bacterium]
MNNLTVFNSDVIPVYTTDTGKKVVIGRELHEKLKIKTEYKDWFPRMCEYGFSEGSDFSSFLSESTGGRPSQNHILSLDMAKHIAMIQRTPEGRAIRQKLIELETDISNLSPELRLLIKLEVAQKQQEKALADTNKRLDHIGDVIALDTRSWREDARKLIVQIARARGGNEYLRDVQSEIYKLVDQRGGVSLETRLTNKRRRMADEGVCKSKRDRLNKVDVIADDKKLIEIYVAIVKEMAIKYGIDQQSA